MRIIGALLIALGILAFVYGGFTFTTKKKVIDAGPVEVTSDKTHRVLVPPVLGGLALAAGVGILAFGHKR